MRTSEESKEAPCFCARLAPGRGHREVGELRWLGGEQTEEHRRASGHVPPLEGRLDPERGEDPAQRRREPVGVFANVQARRVEAEARQLRAKSPESIARQHRRNGGGDQIEHGGDLVDGDSSLVRSLVEQPRGHVLL